MNTVTTRLTAMGVGLFVVFAVVAARVAAPTDPVPVRAANGNEANRAGRREVELFSSMNAYGVGTQPTAPTLFTLSRAHIITTITTYHWNGGRGTGKGTIALLDAGGKPIGSWSASGTPGQGGVPNAYWTCTPGVTVPAGTYRVVDSEPATWSQNAQSGGRGMASVKGYPVESPALESAGGAALPAAEQVIVETRVGPAGGTVAAPGQIAVELPAGALASAEKITITRSDPGSTGCGYFQIHREGTGLLRRPATVRFPVGEGVAPAGLCVVHQLVGELAVVVPSRFDPTTRTLSTTTLSFSGFGWDDWGKLVGGHQIAAGAAGVGVVVVVATWAGAALTGWALGSAAISAWAATIGLGKAAVAGLILGIGGLIAEGPLARRGLDRQLVVRPDPTRESARFLLRWDSNGDPPALFRDCVTAFSDSGGRIAFWASGAVSDQVWRDLTAELARTQPQGASLPQVANLRPVSVPRAILQAAAELCLSRSILQRCKLPVPDEVEVLFKAPDTGDSGLWAAPFLYLDPRQLAVRDTSGSGLRTRRATLLHEYYHACCSLQRITNNTYPWLEEAIATSLEAEFVGCEDYLDKQDGYDWPVAGPVLGSGFVLPRTERKGEGDPVKRGYRIWPWPRWIAHSSGFDTLWRAARDELSNAEVAGLFDGLAMALLSADRSLEDPATTTHPWGTRAAVSTGWKRRKLADFIAGGPGSPGQPALPSHLAAPRPLSVNVVSVPLAEHGATSGPLVVRRSQVSPEEAYWLMPPASATILQPSASFRRGNGGLVVPGAVVKDGGTWPLALVNHSATASAPNPLLLYRLNPPTALKVTPLPAGGTTRLQWTVPDLESPLKPAECLLGYRLFGRTREGREDLIGELYFDLPESSLVQLPGKLVLSIPSTRTQVELPAATTKPYAALGLQSAEKVLRQDGRLVLSRVEWSPAPCVLTIEPARFQGQPNKTYTFTARADFPPANARFEWAINGQPLKSTVGAVRLTFPSPRAVTLVAKLLDGAGAVLCTATATGTIEAPAESSPQPAPPQPVPPQAVPPRPGPIPATGVWVLTNRTVEKGKTESTPVLTTDLAVGGTTATSKTRRQITAKTASGPYAPVGLKADLHYDFQMTWSELPSRFVPGEPIKTTATVTNTGSRVAVLEGDVKYLGDGRFGTGTLEIYVRSVGNSVTDLDRIDSPVENSFKGAHMTAPCEVRVYWDPKKTGGPTSQTRTLEFNPARWADPQNCKMLRIIVHGTGHFTGFFVRYDYTFQPPTSGGQGRANP